jgi:hypothetical protein
MNQTEILGPTPLINNLHQRMIQTNEVFNVLYPVATDVSPDDLQAWQVSNWGTKWDVSPNEITLDIIDRKDGTSLMILYYDTAWSPAVPVFDYFVNEHPECHIIVRYYEPGMSFGGMWESDIGEITWDEICNIADVPNELEDFFNIKEFMDW